MCRLFILQSVLLCLFVSSLCVCVFRNPTLFQPLWIAKKKVSISRGGMNVWGCVRINTPTRRILYVCIDCFCHCLWMRDETLYILHSIYTMYVCTYHLRTYIYVYILWKIEEKSSGTKTDVSDGSNKGNKGENKSGWIDSIKNWIPKRPTQVWQNGACMCVYVCLSLCVCVWYESPYPLCRM